MDAEPGGADWLLTGIETKDCKNLLHFAARQNRRFPTDRAGELGEIGSVSVKFID